MNETKAKQMKKKPIKVLRDELFDKVWTTPMSRLAPKYGISDSGLAKVCKRMEIPRPPRGYWQQLATGKNPPKARLKPLSEKGVDQVIIQPIQKREPTLTSDAIPEEIIVPDALFDPHPLVQKSLIGLNKGKAQDRGIIWSKNKICLDIKVTRDSIERACLIMDTLIKALINRDCLVEVTKERPVKTIVTINDEHFEIGIDEKTNQQTHKATADEKKDHPHGWGIPKYDYFPSGLLILKIRDISYYGIRQQWSDGKIQRIENCLGDFIAGLYLAADVRKERRIERARQKEEWERERIRRAEMQRLAEIEQEKTKKLTSDVTNWELAQRITAYLDALDQLSPNIEGLSEWTSWARGYAKAINPLENQDSIIFNLQDHPYL